jgi:hypothetical protein
LQQISDSKEKYRACAIRETPSQTEEPSEKTLFERGFVTGHDFSHAEKARKTKIRLQPLQMRRPPHQPFQQALKPCQFCATLSHD